MTRGRRSGYKIRKQGRGKQQLGRSLLNKLRKPSRLSNNFKMTSSKLESQRRIRIIVY